MTDSSSLAGEPIVLKDAPRMAGLSFRHFRGDEDFPGLLKVNTGSKVADGLTQDLHTLETIKHSYSNSHNHDPYRDVLIADLHGDMVAFLRVFMESEPDDSHSYWFHLFLLPEVRGFDLERSMLHWVEIHARERDKTEGNGKTIYAATDIYSTSTWLEELVQEAGYKPDRFGFHMETPNLDNIPDVPLPAGLEIRPATPEHYRAIWEASVEAFRDLPGTSEPEEGDFEARMAAPDIRPDLWVVAWDGDQVAGSILNFISERYNEASGRKVGWTESISVRRPWRRRGLARAMLARSMQLHRDQGMTQTALGVDTQNPSGALQLYESMGYQVVVKATAYKKRL